MQRLHGIFCPNTVPLTDRGEINEPELRRYIDWLTTTSPESAGGAADTGGTGNTGSAL